MITLKNVSEDMMITFAKKCAKISKNGFIWAINGDVGCGKTFFCRHFITHLIKNERITSPTYSICESYQNKNLTINHYDLYRINSYDELFFLDLDFNNCISLIEWSDIALPIIKNKAVFLNIIYESQNTRNIEVKNPTDEIIQILNENSFNYE